MILVTGATGCLGSALVRALVLRGERVAALRLLDAAPPAQLAAFADRIDWRIGDVRDVPSVRAALDGVTHVYHLAGIAVPFNRLRRHMQEINVGGTATLAALAREAGVRRVVYTSSSSTIGIPEDGFAASETFAYNGERFNFGYMHSKRGAEEAILREAARGLDVVIVNPTAVMAPGGDTGSGWCGAVSAIAERRLRLVPSGGVAVVTGDDMVDGHVKAMARGRSGERYILNTVNITYRELVLMIAAVAGAAPPRAIAPSGLLRVAGAFNTARNALRRDPMSSSPLTWEHVPLLSRRVYYDQSKAVRELELSQTSLRAAVEDVYRWWQTATGRTTATGEHAAAGSV